jgi:DNA-directed RNA polymerase specialized sigma24 family protein
MTARLPDTRDTLIAALGSGRPADRDRALDLIARAYRDAVVESLALRWQLARDDAEDLAQEFFAAAIAKDWFARFEPSRGRFRTFLRSCLDDFARASFRDAARLKRGGGVAHLPLDDASLTLGANTEVDALFDREWARSVLGIALERLRHDCDAQSRAVAWRLYERYDLSDLPDAQRPTYAALAAETGEPITQVTNHLHWARKRMREHVLATVRALTADDAEYRAEVRALTGVDPT